MTFGALRLRLVQKPLTVLTQNPPESDKAQRYLQQLDEARCAGRWSDVPELCRKVDKHAPHRKFQCNSLSGPQEPDNYRAFSGNVIPTLLTAIEEADSHAQDAFQATVCLGWLHYVLEEPDLAVARLPKDFGAVATQLSGEAATLTGWSRVCLVKGTYLKGSALEKTGAVKEAVATYSSIVPWLATTTSPNTESVQFKMWSENALVRLCQLSDQSSGAGTHVDPSEALRTYRQWAKHWDATAKSGGSDEAHQARHRRLAWKSYYDTLSTILRNDLPYEPDSTPETQEKSSLYSQSSMRLRQRAELKRVETIYENLLIKETHFPKASETNHEIETWVDSVMDNWRLLCGPTWDDNDLGEGGKEGIGRSVLDILYRAATKTFHSTQILRHLFVVHASLAEFDLAFKAYDSYVVIITRGKDRAEKSGEEDAHIDDDSTVLRTSAEAIRVLCKFGCRKEAEKALEIGHNIERWLEQTNHIQSTSDASSVTSIEALVEPSALAVAYCAIGVSQAHWARFTYEVEARASIQAKAVQYLRKSLAQSLGESNNVEALYALSLVLAETRDIPGAIKAVKRALTQAPRATTTSTPDGVLSDGIATEFGRERKLIPLWHLLALLLTSRSDYTAAAKACEAAFEQFGDPAILFGREESGLFRSEHLNEATGKDIPSSGIVDRMERYEKTSILQIKMTQLALVEVTDGTLAAVDGCDELLALYGRLFGDPSSEKPKLQPPTTLVPPKSAAGTVRGSIFRGRGTVKAPPQGTDIRNSSVISAKSSGAVAQQGAPPAIQVTDGDKSQSSGHHRHHLFHHHKHEDSATSLGRSGSKLQKRSASARRSTVTDGDQPHEVPPLPENSVNGTTTQTSPGPNKSPRRQSNASTPRKSLESSDRPLRSIPHNLPHASPPLNHSDPPQQDTRLPSRVPHSDFVPLDPHFSKLQERRQKVSLLISVWLFISGLYTRAQMFSDAREAIAEALKLVEAFEAEASLESSTAKALADKGWGGGKSVEELWADAYTARGDLLAAQSHKHQARAEFERALMHHPDHPEAIVGLSNILLDIYSEVIPLEPALTADHTSPPACPSPSVEQSISHSKTQYLTSHTPSVENQLSPPELTRLAARDRAFALLSTLTKFGTGWDYSEAWFALARAYEESGQIEKAKEVLWWCVQLEDTHPVRNWKHVTIGGFVL
ncbi:similar to filamentation protein (Rhf1) [Plenodomus lingam JN3]|uniref:Similar to filamentation protein (Rhf1) n=1 Tax=Leptosphaeria maculans (strain JN3 / isolate v23.1.3 / race Av1-4-5-6-7-8) TaxID=985895 RepID=E5AAN1_LEPMJ|nr:similar to filamentation protein (Rhf1) [Plenodomus lingam JN3]CBY00722.1 similar to filamentation protein (Rhf1) [Plenodomus lingam JN3]